MENCTIYSHSVDFDKVIEIVRSTLPDADVKINKDLEKDGISIILKGGFLKKHKFLTIKRRVRAKPSYKLERPDCPLSQNLAGMINFVHSIPTDHTGSKDLLIRKIATLNMEMPFMAEPEMTDEFAGILDRILKEFKAIAFVSPSHYFNASSLQHFMDQDQQLILDMHGDSRITQLNIEIDSSYYDQPAENVSEEQRNRKNKNIEWLKQNGIKVSENMPTIQSAGSTTLRTPKEIAERAVILAITNLVAFDSCTGDEAVVFLTEHHLLDRVTPGEKEFLNDPTPERKNYETWKCEGIWTLLWALKVVPDLGSPNEMCNLNDIDPKDYPIVQGENPNDFINKFSSSRSKEELLDMNDLYYRINWACVDARIHGNPMEKANPGVVYERHYALNWLIGYKNQDWDHVTTDT